jgi:putative ABC transport system permease protein
MFMHDLRLAFRSLKRNPILSALMVAAIACGIATSMIAITLYHARAGNPIPWKSDKLFAVALDARDDDPAFANPQRPDDPPNRLTYRDAAALYQSKIPVRAVMHYRGGHLVTPDQQGVKPFQQVSRVTTADYFEMFDVPFQFGSGWSRVADDAPEPVVVISRYLNDKLFGGGNNIGKTVILDRRPFRVVGILDYWMPQPRYDEVSGGGAEIMEDLYIPFGWARAMQITTRGGINCISKRAKITSFEGTFTEDCVWLNYWVELPNAAARERFQEFVDSYANEQRKVGRFPRKKNNNKVLNVEEWLQFNNVIGDENRMQVALGGMFLLVCILNTLGLMLAKFLSAAPVSGLRRALGATRADIVRQHLMEVVVVGLVGGAVGLALTFGGLELIRDLMSENFITDDHPDRVAKLRALTGLDLPMVFTAVGLSMIAGVLAGLYPAWRIGRLSPSTFLKNQ